MSKRKHRDPKLFVVHPLGVPSRLLLRNNTTLLEVMTTYIQDGPHCGKKGTKQS
jgi:hypothetical protein